MFPGTISNLDLVIMRFRSYLFVPIFVFPFIMGGCSSDSNSIEEEDDSSEAVDTSLELTIEPGTLHVLMDNNIASYYIQQGQPRGFDYEMLKWYCKDHGIRLSIDVIPNFDYILDSLVAGKGDLAAGNLTITGDRLKRVHFSHPLHYTRQVLVQRITPEARRSRTVRKEWLVDHILELDGKTVYVNKTSAFSERLKGIATENGIEINIAEVSADVSYTRLIEMVSEGDIDLTVADENIAKLHRAFYPNIDINTPISLTQAIAWAIPEGHDSLQASINTWLDSKLSTSRYNIIYNKYFGQSGRHDRRSLGEIQNGIISPFDDIIKKRATEMNWDWRLLAAMIQQESRFNPNAESRFGAAGLMQVMPNTSERFGVSGPDIFNPELNIKAGTGFLLWLEDYWSKKLSDTTDIIPFCLASYNVGLGHVIDARNLALKYGLKPDVWKDNVEVMLKNKMLPKYYQDPVVEHGYCRGSEPYHYVRHVMDTYQYYIEFTDNNTPSTSLAVAAVIPRKLTDFIAWNP